MQPPTAFDYRRLTIAERLQLVEDIWDSIAEDADVATLPLTDVERAELDRRLSELDANPSGGVSWDTVRARLVDRLMR
jgi:putative addiction module component (TIGR02574 family)